MDNAKYHRFLAYLSPEWRGITSISKQSKQPRRKVAKIMGILRTQGLVEYKPTTCRINSNTGLWRLKQ